MNSTPLFSRWLLALPFRSTFCSPADLNRFWFAAAALVAFVHNELRANTFVSDNTGNINEPSQRALILFDQGREDLVVQAKYEGRTQEFGWIIPVPGAPEVKQGSI